MNTAIKINFPDLKRTTNLFQLQPHQVTETHSNILKQIEREVQHGGVRTKENFLLTYDRLIVVLMISLLPDLSLLLRSNHVTRTLGRLESVA